VAVLGSTPSSRFMKVSRWRYIAVAAAPLEGVPVEGNIPVGFRKSRAQADDQCAEVGLGLVLRGVGPEEEVVSLMEGGSTRSWSRSVLEGAKAALVVRNDGLPPGMAYRKWR
jgi:hypothetical protein